MRLQPGEYQTEAGSTMIVRGRHGGGRQVGLEWMDEENACVDCEPEPYDQDGFLVWNCDFCGGGSAKLFPVNLSAESNAAKKAARYMVTI